MSELNGPELINNEHWLCYIYLNENKDNIMNIEVLKIHQLSYVFINESKDNYMNIDVMKIFQDNERKRI